LIENKTAAAATPSLRLPRGHTCCLLPWHPRLGFRIIF
jgi:hypothetical protein